MSEDRAFRAYAGVLDWLIMRVEHIEEAVRSAGIELREVDTAAVDEWIAASAQARDEAKDPRR